MAVRVLMSICQVYSWLIIARVVIGWLNPRPGNTYLIMVCRLTDPLLNLLRPLIPIRGIDLSPILALLLVRFLCEMLARSAI